MRAGVEHRLHAISWTGLPGRVSLALPGGFVNTQSSARSGDLRNAAGREAVSVKPSQVRLGPAVPGSLCATPRVSACTLRACLS